MAYYDFYSKLMLQDRERDANGDGSLTLDKVAPLGGFDVGWNMDREGRTSVLSGVLAVAMGRREGFTAR